MKPIDIIQHPFTAYKRRDGHVIHRRGFRQIQIEITTKCNLRCRMCPHHEHPAWLEIRDMDMETFLQILNYIQELPEKLTRGCIVVPVGYGEPLMCKQFKRYLMLLDECLPKHMSTQINTNAVLLKPDKYQSLSLIDDIVISLNAPNPGMYEYVNGLDLFNVVVKNTRGFLDYLTEKGPPIPKVRVQLFDQYQDQRDKIERMLNGHNGTHADIFVHPVYKALTDDSPETVREPCWALLNMVFIDVHGRLYPCCLGPHKGKESSLYQGHVWDTSLMDAYKEWSRIIEFKAQKRCSPGLQYSDCGSCDMFAPESHPLVKWGDRWW